MKLLPHGTSLRVLLGTYIAQESHFLAPTGPMHQIVYLRREADGTVSVQTTQSAQKVGLSEQELQRSHVLLGASEALVVGAEATLCVPEQYTESWLDVSRLPTKKSGALDSLCTDRLLSCANVCVHLYTVLHQCH